jgi:hypothetical protein
MKHNEPTIPGPYTHNEPTIADSYYPYSGGSEIPPPPPNVHKSRTRTFIIMGVLCVVLVSVMGGYALGTNKETQKPNGARVTSTSTTIQTSNLNYTACDIMKDINRVQHQPSEICYKSTTSIYSWSYNTWTSNVPFISSITFGDTSGCTGPCTPAQAGVWVYATEKDALDAFNEVERQIINGSVPQGPAGIDTVAYMHGRCLLLGESGASIYGQVVRKDCT